MIELTKRDIEAIAIRRFNRRYLWHLVGFFLGWGILAFVIISTLPDKPSLILEIGVSAPLVAIYAGGAIWWVKSESKARKALVKQCQDDPILTYKSTEAELLQQLKERK